MKVLVDYPRYTAQEQQERHEAIIHALVCNGDHIAGFGLKVSTLVHPDTGSVQVVIELSAVHENVTPRNIKAALERLIDRLHYPCQMNR